MIIHMSIRESATLGLRGPRTSARGIAPTYPPRRRPYSNQNGETVRHQPVDVEPLGEHQPEHHAEDAEPALPRTELRDR